MIDDKITANLIDESITANDSNSLVDDNITANETDETLAVKLSDTSVSASLQDSDMAVRLDIGTFREYNYNRLENKPSINGVILQGDKSAVELRLVPIDLSPFEAVSEPTKSFRQSVDMFVNNNTNPRRITLQAVKDMNTKIVAVNDSSQIDYNKLDIDDYVYIKNNTDYSRSKIQSLIKDGYITVNKKREKESYKVK